VYGVEPARGGAGGLGRAGEEIDEGWAVRWLGSALRARTPTPTLPRIGGGGRNALTPRRSCRGRSERCLVTSVQKESRALAGLGGRAGGTEAGGDLGAGGRCEGGGEDREKEVGVEGATVSAEGAVRLRGEGEGGARGGKDAPGVEEVTRRADARF